MWKSALISTLTLWLAISVYPENLVLSHPLPQPQWQSEVKVNPSYPITVRLLNETNKTLEYALANAYSTPIPPGGTGVLLLQVGRETSETSTILINTPQWTNPLVYDFQVVPSNQLKVRIRETRADDPNQDQTIYINERGHVSAF